MQDSPTAKIIWLKMAVVPCLRKPCLGPWLSISSRCQNPLKDLLKHRLLGPQSFQYSNSKMESRNLFSWHLISQVVPEAPKSGDHTFKSPCPSSHSQLPFQLSTCPENVVRLTLAQSLQIAIHPHKEGSKEAPL